MVVLNNTAVLGTALLLDVPENLCGLRGDADLDDETLEAALETLVRHHLAVIRN